MLSQEDEECRCASERIVFERDGSAAPGENNAGQLILVIPLHVSRARAPDIGFIFPFRS